MIEDETDKFDKSDPSPSGFNEKPMWAKTSTVSAWNDCYEWGNAFRVDQASAISVMAIGTRFRDEKKLEDG